MSTSVSSPDESPWLKAMPGIFVLLWSTGFIGAKYGLPYAEPLTFLFLRFFLLVVILGLAALLLRAPWPATWRETGHIAMAGILVHGGYLGGVFSAIHQGLPAALVALIVGLQPLLTALGAQLFLGERVRPQQWVGLGLGLFGVILVLAEKLDLGGLNGRGVALAVFALFGITIGTLYQKRHCTGMDMRTGLALQFGAAAVPMGLLALALESRVVQWTPTFMLTMAWLVGVLSIGTMALLWIMVRRGAVSKVAGLFYLVPPVTALLAWALFGEALGPVALIGMAVTALGVALALKGGK
ncbi:DMT family transporter [Magnetospira thiophila]